MRQENQPKYSLLGNQPIPQSFFRARSAIRDKPGKTREPEASPNYQPWNNFRSTSREDASDKNMDTTRGLLKLLNRRKDIEEAPREHEDKMLETFQDMLSQKSNRGFQIHNNGLGSFNNRSTAQVAPTLSTRTAKVDDFAFNRLKSTKFERPAELFEESNKWVKPVEGPYYSRPTNLSSEQPRFRRDHSDGKRTPTANEIQNPDVSVLGDPYRKYAMPSNYRSMGNTGRGIFNNLRILEEQVEQTLFSRSLYLLTAIVLAEYFISFSYLELPLVDTLKALAVRSLLFIIVALYLINNVDKLPFDFLDFVKANYISGISTAGKSLIILAICFWYVDINFQESEIAIGPCRQWYFRVLRSLMPFVILYKLQVNSAVNKFSRGLNYRRFITGIPALAVGRLWAAALLFIKMAITAVLFCWFLSFRNRYIDRLNSIDEFAFSESTNAETEELNMWDLVAWELQYNALVQTVKLIGVAQLISCLQWRLASVTMNSLYDRSSSREQPVCFLTFTEVNASYSNSGSRVNQVSEFHALNNIAQASKMIFLMTSSSRSSSDDRYGDFGKECMWETFIKLTLYDLRELAQALEIIKVDELDSRTLSRGSGTLYTFDSMLKHLLSSTGYRQLVGTIARRKDIMTMSLEILVRTLNSFNSAGKSPQMQGDEALIEVAKLLKSVTLDLQQEVHRLKVHPEAARHISLSTPVVRELVEFSSRLRAFTGLCLNLCPN